MLQDIIEKIETEYHRPVGGILKLLAAQSGASTYAECVELLQKHRLIPVEFCEKCGEPLYAGDFGKTSGCVPCGILWMS